jgi:antitoxin (DNA-binding transcriptional repressor) of toxin-antitoxin stability system
LTTEEAQVKLPEIIDKLARGGEVLITRNAQSVAKLVGQVQSTRKPRQPDTCGGMFIIVSDEDEHLGALPTTCHKGSTLHQRISVIRAKRGPI